MTQYRQHSAWEDSYATERQRQVANQGGAEDAQRRIERHQNANRRNPNRTVVSSYSYHELDNDREFNAVAPGKRSSRPHGNSSFGERNARATWSSSSNNGFPQSRSSSSSAVRGLIVPAIIVVVVFVVIALIVRSCMG